MEPLTDEADRIIVEMLAVGAKDAAIASTAGVSTRTVARRKLDPEIRERVSQLTQQEFRGYLAKLNELSTVAFERTKFLMENAKSQSTQMRAIEMWFNMRMRMFQEVETAEKLREIQAQLGTQPNAIVSR